MAKLEAGPRVGDYATILPLDVYCDRENCPLRAHGEVVTSRGVVAGKFCRRHVRREVKRYTEQMDPFQPGPRKCPWCGSAPELLRRGPGCQVLCAQCPTYHAGFRAPVGQTEEQAWAHWASMVRHTLVARRGFSDGE